MEQVIRGYISHMGKNETAQQTITKRNNVMKMKAIKTATGNAQVSGSYLTEKGEVVTIACRCPQTDENGIFAGTVIGDETLQFGGTSALGKDNKYNRQENYKGGFDWSNVVSLPPGTKFIAQVVSGSIYSMAEIRIEIINSEDSFKDLVYRHKRRLLDAEYGKIAGNDARPVAV